jgi:hypothetical protein
MMQATSRGYRPALRWALFLAAIVCGRAGNALAQVSPTPSPIVKQAPTVTREVPTLAAPDLVIDRAQIAPRINQDALLADAFVTIRNAGSLDAVFHKGAVVVSGAAADAHGMRFANALAGEDFTLKQGETQTAVLRTVDACGGGFNASPVTFRADPQGLVPERQRGNNTSAVTPAVADPAAADLVVSSMRLQWGTDPRDNRSPAFLLVVTVKNSGAGPALFCPGMTLVRQTATPVSAKYGLQNAFYGQPTTPPAVPPLPTDPVPGDHRLEIDHMPPQYNVVILPGATHDFNLLACKTGDLPPGIYEWKAKVNPDGAARESNLGNNEGTAQLQGCQ